MEKILIDIRNEEDSIKEEYKNKDTVSVRELLNTISDLKCELEATKEHYEDIIEDRERQIQDNYRQITPTEMYGI